MKLFRLIPVLALLLLWGCSGKDLKVNVPEKSMISGLASPVTLSTKGGDINLNDYFDDPAQIDSVSLLPGFNLSIDKKQGMLHATPNGGIILPMFEIRVWNKGFAYSFQEALF